MDDFGFLDLIWTLLIAFGLVMFLVVLFNVVVDLFRDHELSGWWKAAWIILLLFLPLVGTLIYLIARGGGMAERGQRAYRAQVDALRAEVGGGLSPAEQIARAKELLDAGAITQDEFDRLKGRALAA